MSKADSAIQYIIRGAEGLPAAAISEEVNEALISHDTLIVTAPPGAGKSTLLPLTLLNGLTTRATQTDEKPGSIIVLEPRRLAARQIAERMASMLGEPVGQTVGYRVRMESRISDQTRIEVVTEGILTRRLIDDPTLDGVQVVIFDEFHERSLHSDEALALTRQAQQLIRPDLRIVIMSATIDTSQLELQLAAQVISCEGRMFPIETYHADLASLAGAPVSKVAEEVCHAIRQAHRKHEGDILAFLPGEAEIRRSAEILADTLGTTHICPLYGMLSFQDQQRAIAPSRPGERKVVLATPIAETSLTIEGVRVVIDSGLCRELVVDQQTGLSHLSTAQISLDRADQRRGRAGRVAAGICYRLWSLATEHRMQACRQPEILEADLANLVLDVAAWGEPHPEQLPWLTPPPAAHVAQASRLLQLLGALDDDGKITRHGQALAQLPCHPRIAQMLIMAQECDQQGIASDLAALLEEKDPLTTEPSADLSLRLAALQTARKASHPSRTWERILLISQQYRQLCHNRPATSRQQPRSAGSLLAAAYPERIAQALPEGCGRFRLASGDYVMVDAADSLSAHGWLEVASLHRQQGGVGRIFSALPLSHDELARFSHPCNNLTWDAKRGQMLARQEVRIGCLIVDSKPLPAADNTLRDQIISTLCEAAVKEGTSMFDFSDAVGNLQRRVAAVRTWHPELELPDLATDAVLQRADEWLPFCLSEWRNLCNISTNELRKIDLCAALWTLLSYEQQQQVEHLAPTHITVPTGSRIRVEYRQGAECPILRVRLQECFGMTDTPRVDNNRQPILMELLSPGFKPVQLTQDLRNFWQSTYFEVRKELRRRYPKHAWPDDPLNAAPTRKVAAKSSQS